MMVLAKSTCRQLACILAEIAISAMNYTEDQIQDNWDSIQTYAAMQGQKILEKWSVFHNDEKWFIYTDIKENEENDD